MTVEVAFRAVQTIDDESTETVWTARGTVETTENGWHLFYTEPSEDGADVSIMVRKKQVVIKRRGETVSRMILETGHRHLCRYDTPYGKLNLYTNTTALTVTPTRIEAVYLLEMNGGYTTQEIEIAIKEVSEC